VQVRNTAVYFNALFVNWSLEIYVTYCSNLYRRGGPPPPGRRQKQMLRRACLLGLWKCRILQQLVMKN
jgi:hypothetical protein